MNRFLLLLSSSKVHGYGFLEYAADDINKFLKKKNVTSILFIPYALTNYDAYLEQVKEPFLRWGYNIKGIHQGKNPVEEVEKAEAFFVGGGNTFLLLKSLYDNNLIDKIRKRVLQDGIPYIGSSAGTNVATRSINTTNDMPIVYPPSFNALNLIPFNINPHYLDPEPNSTHKGETREERILQYQGLSHSAPVLGLREGCSIWVEGNFLWLKGLHNSRLFIPGKKPEEIKPETDISFLLEEKDKIL